MAIDNRDLKAGMKLTARYKKQDHSAEVVETEEGLRIRLADGREFKSLSSAGSAITGGAINGWRFWSLADGEAKPAAKTEAAKSAAKRQTTKKPAAGAKKPTGQAANTGADSADAKPSGDKATEAS